MYDCYSIATCCESEAVGSALFHGVRSWWYSPSEGLIKQYELIDKGLSSIQMMG